MWWTDELGDLFSLGARTRWEGLGWVSAECMRNPISSLEEVPGEACSCGFYAFKSMDIVAAELFNLLLGAPGPLPSALVCGGVELAGKVIEHEIGYRAERARVTEVHPIPGFEAEAAAVARKQSVPVKERIAHVSDYFGRPHVSEEPRVVWMLGPPTEGAS